MTSGLTVFAAIAATVTSADAPPTPAPIHMVAEPMGSGVRLKVIGSSTSVLEAKYELEAIGGPRDGNNRSVQRGEARLLPGIPVTLVTVTLDNVNSGGWSARLTVEPRGGASYDQVLASGMSARPPE